MRRTELDIALRGLRSLPDTSVTLFDRDLRYVAASGRALADAGFDPDALAGRLIADVLPPERWAFWEPHYRRALAGETVTVELTGMAGDRFYQVDVVPWLEPDGRVEGGLAIIRDITERRRGEDAQAYLSALISDSPDATIRKTLDGTITSWNAGAERLYGYSAEEAVGRDIRMIAFADTGLPVSEILERVSGGEVVREETVRRARDGREVHVALTVAPITDQSGRVIGASTVARDLSALRVAQDQARTAERRWRTIYDSSLLGVAVRTTDGRLVECNARYAELFESTPESLAGTRPEETFTVLDGGLVMPMFEDDPEADAIEVERTVQLPSGNQRRVRVNGYTVPGPDRHRLLIVDDVTEQRRLADALDRGRRVEAIGRLAGGVAHELNNQLSIILGYARLIGSHVDGDPTLREQLGEIAAAAETSAALTSDLLAFGRRRHLERDLVDVSAVARGLGRILGPALGAHIELVVRDRAPGAMIIGERAGLEQVLLSLALNAAAAMPNGGEATIEIDLTADGQVAVTVSDTGHGMTAEVREHAFDPFFTTQEFGRASGLGLSTALGTIEQMGGAIEITATSPRGTTVQILIPAADPQDAARAPAGADGPDGAGARILLVEDEDAVRELVALMLTDAGHDVLAVPGVAEALRVLSAPERIDLLLSDIVLGDGRGDELAQQAAALRPGLAAVYMSGYAPDTVGAGIGSGQRVLAKPFTQSDLTSAVRDALLAGR